MPQVPNGLNLLYYKMDKKSIVNDLYQVTVISAFVVWYSMLGKKVFKMTSLSIQKIRSRRHGETGCHCSCIRDDGRIPY